MLHTDTYTYVGDIRMRNIEILGDQNCWREVLFGAFRSKLLDFYARMFSLQDLIPSEERRKEGEIEMGML